jgi:uncharacterized membrane protein
MQKIVIEAPYLKFKADGIDDARAILSAMLGCVSTVLALIFSVALLVLSMVANLLARACCIALCKTG